MSKTFTARRTCIIRSMQLTTVHLGEDDAKMLLARALQLFMPGKPQIWYLDLFAGKNDHEAVKRAGAGGHKEINRTNLTTEQMEEALKKPVVARQLELLRFRSTCPAFEKESRIMINSDGNKMEFTWENDGYQAKLKADLKNIRICDYRNSTGRTDKNTVKYLAIFKF